MDTKIPRARAFPGNLCMAESVPFCQRHYYRGENPISEMMHPLFFNSVRDNLRACDIITLVQSSTPGLPGERCLEMQTVVVVNIAPDGIDIQPIEPLMKFEGSGETPSVDLESVAKKKKSA